MNRSRLAVPALVALATLAVPSAVLAGGHPATAAPAAGSQSADPDREGLSVSGTGIVFGDPDTLDANFAVETTAATVGEALTGANAAATRMRDALVAAGIAKADLRTADVGVSERRNDKDEITGYTANQGLTAKIRKLADAGKLLSTAIKAGGDAARLHGISFGIEDDSKLLAEARKKAFAEARGKAALYAGEAGRSLDRVVKVTEDNPRYGGPAQQFKLSAAMAAADAETPIEPGRQQIAVTVTVEWAFGPADK
jgi:uncharacterized protein YggE